MKLDERARLAVLPFAIMELWDVPCAYERSLKFSRAGLLANRYMIGVSSELINAEQLLLACRQMRMPQLFEGPIRESFDQANLVLLGFENSFWRAKTRSRKDVSYQRSLFSRYHLSRVRERFIADLVAFYVQLELDFNFASWRLGA